MCCVCDIVNWIIAYIILSLIGILLFKVIIHYQNNGTVTMSGMVLDDKTWERDTRALVAGLLFPFLFWGVAACIRLTLWKAFVTTPYRMATTHNV